MKDYDYSYLDCFEDEAEAVPDLAHLRHFLEGIVEALYEDGDIDKLERCLEEVCDSLDVHIPPSYFGNLKVKKDVKHG